MANKLGVVDTILAALRGIAIFLIVAIVCGVVVILLFADRR